MNTDVAIVLPFAPRVPVIRDRGLPHQIDFVKSPDQVTGLGCLVTCNCGAMAPGNHGDIAEAWRFYRAHLAGAW